MTAVTVSTDPAGSCPEIVCHECGLAHRRRTLPSGARASCSRCGHRLYAYRPPTIDRALALTIAGLVLFVVANVYPFLGLRMGSQLIESTLMTGSLTLYLQGKWELALVVVGTSVLAPGLQLIGLLYVLLPLRLGHTPRDLARVFRLVEGLGHWAMMDVFLLGILVSTVKLADMATIVAGPALLAFVLLIFVLAGAQSAIDPDRIWSQIRTRLRRASPDLDLPQPFECGSCHLTVARPRKTLSGTERCPRCTAPLHHRKKDSLQRSWALLLAACICYLPANMLPIMHVTSLGQVQSDTILSGVFYLLHHGQWPLALIVFVASVFVPVLKIALLLFLLWSVQQHSRWRPVERTRLYRITEAVGRWSMVDVYVVTVLVALVQLGNLASIEAGWGAVYFAAVVVLTMLSAMSFDPRLIWDRLEKGIT
jgi:paraquat-inducible protein A